MDANARRVIQLPPSRLAASAMEQLGDALAGPDARHRLTTLPSEPGPLFSFGCFECQLHDDPRVDFLACVLDEDGGREAVRAQRSQIAGAQRILLDAWAEPTEASLDTAGLWFEWDQPADRAWAPFAFVRAAGRVPAGRWQRWRLQRWLDWAGPLLGEGGIAPDMRAEVLRVNDVLPDSCKIHHLASLASRKSRAVRLHAGIAKRDLPLCLRSLGWRGPSEVVESALAEWSVLPDPIGIQLEVTGHSLEWVDLEFYFNTTPLEDPRWQAFPRWVERHASIVPGRLAAALAWGEARSLPDGGGILLRRTSFKARIAASGEVNAKAYLGFSPRTLSA